MLGRAPLGVAPLCTLEDGDITFVASETTTANTSHTVSLSAGTGGRCLIAFVYEATLSPSVTFPGGWSQITSDAATVLVGMVVYEHLSPGTGTIAVTTGSAVEMEAHCWRIQGRHATTPSEGATANSTVGTANPDPPNEAPSGGSAAYVWIAVFGSAVSEPATAYPATFPEFQRTNNSGGATGVGIGSAVLHETAASENPGTFTMASSRAWTAATVAVPPPGGAAAAVTHFLSLLGAGG